MFFNSIHYILFLPLVVIIYYAIPPKFRWILQLTASYYFYMCWKVEYVVLIMISTMIDYYAGLKMSAHDTRQGRKKFLVLSIVSNLGILFSFKYFNFFSESFVSLLQPFNVFYDAPLFNVLLPVGISFYTFQSMSYSIDVYRGHTKAEKHPGFFALYVAFFPQLVAGPIERSTTFLPQLHKTINFNYQEFSEGLRLILWGMFKKIVIADRLAVYVNTIYDAPADFSGPPILLGIYFFGLQVYCDFSGYSDIAIGSAKLMGINLMKNFNSPFFARSLSEYWRRWHISLSSWIRDYLYRPLLGMFGIRKVSSIYLAIFAAFALNGLWHGANWKFVVWGVVHGVMLIIETITEPVRRVFLEKTGLNGFPKALTLFRIFFTFHSVCITYIIFRVNTLGDAFIIMKNLVPNQLGQIGINVTMGAHEIFLGFLYSGVLLVTDWLNWKYPGKKFKEYPFLKNVLFRWAIYYFLFISIIIFGFHSSSEEFIYFQF